MEGGATVQWRPDLWTADICRLAYRTFSRRHLPENAAKSSVRDALCWACRAYLGLTYGASDRQCLVKRSKEATLLRTESRRNASNGLGHVTASQQGQREFREASRRAPWTPLAELAAEQRMTGEPLSPLNRPDASKHVVAGEPS